jgi:pyrroloquinoline quinone (PQQ) biosynthesis protein C
MVARCRRRGLFLEVAKAVNRRTGFYQVTTPLRALFLRFAAAVGVGEEELEAHWASPETLQATYTRLCYQFDGFEEGFVAMLLCGEAALQDVVGDERPYLCQRGIAGCVKRALGLDDDAVAYFRALEDFREAESETAWRVVREIAVEGSQQEWLRRAVRHWLGIYRNMRRAWNEIADGTYATPEVVWPPPGTRFARGGEQTHAELEEELGEFCTRLPRPRETAIGYLASPECSLAAVREFALDLINMDATRSIAGQFSRLQEPRALAAITQAFATESGCYLTKNHMEIWTDFIEAAFGLTRAEIQAYDPIPETAAIWYLTKYFLVHGLPEEAIAAFHLGPPPRAKAAIGEGALALGQGGTAGGGLMEKPGRSPLTTALERFGIEVDLADYFFRLHREIEPFEQDEGWAYVPAVLETGRQRRVFKRAFITKLLAERTKDGALLARMQALSR